jgi:hypothetical protein
VCISLRFPQTAPLTSPPPGAGFFELYQILKSIFGSKAYYAFGFLGLSSLVVALTTALTSVLFCYFHLAREDYRFVSLPFSCTSFRY